MGCCSFRNIHRRCLHSKFKSRLGGGIVDIITFVLAKKYTNAVALNGVPVQHPRINLTTRHWEIFNPSINGYVDTGIIAEGKDGIIPHIENGNWFIGTVNTGISAQGEKGEPGPRGERGGKGDDGRSIEITNDGMRIKWRYVGDTDWTIIVPLSDLKGIAGDQGLPGKAGTNGETPEMRMSPDVPNTLQYKFPSQNYWTNLFTFEGGSDGEPGEDGETPEFRMNPCVPNMLQYRFPSKDSWTDLYLFDNKNGVDGETPEFRMNPSIPNVLQYKFPSRDYWTI